MPMAPTKNHFPTLVQELLYADGTNLIAHIEEDMQAIMKLSSDAYVIFKLTISHTKNRIRYSHIAGCPYIESNIFLYLLDIFI